MRCPGLIGRHNSEFREKRSNAPPWFSSLQWELTVSDKTVIEYGLSFGLYPDRWEFPYFHPIFIPWFLSCLLAVPCCRKLLKETWNKICIYWWNVLSIRNNCRSRKREVGLWALLPSCTSVLKQLERELDLGEYLSIVCFAFQIEIRSSSTYTVND